MPDGRPKPFSYFSNRDAAVCNDFDVICLFLEQMNLFCMDLIKKRGEGVVPNASNFQLSNNDFLGGAQSLKNHLPFWIFVQN